MLFFARCRTSDKIFSYYFCLFSVVFSTSLLVSVVLFGINFFLGDCQIKHEIKRIMQALCLSRQNSNNFSDLFFDFSFGLLWVDLFFFFENLLSVFNTLKSKLRTQLRVLRRCIKRATLLILLDMSKIHDRFSLSHKIHGKLDR